MRVVLMLSLVMFGFAAQAATPDAGTLSAHELYLRAYQLRESSPDEALKLFNQVIAMTPPGNEDHEKARLRAAALLGKP